MYSEKCLAATGRMNNLEKEVISEMLPWGGIGSQQMEENKQISRLKGKLETDDCVVDCG